MVWRKRFLKKKLKQTLISLSIQLRQTLFSPGQALMNKLLKSFLFQLGNLVAYNHLHYARLGQAASSLLPEKEDSGLLDWQDLLMFLLISEQRMIRQCLSWHLLKTFSVKILMQWRLQLVFSD